MIKGNYEVAANVPCLLGEGPLWHPDEQRLYWTDIDGKRIYRLDPDSGHVEVACEAGMRVGGITLQPDGAIALFGDDGKISLLLDDQLHPILPGLPEEMGNRFNDVFADSVGRVFAGTMSMPDRKGRLYRIDPDLSHHLLLEEIGCSNGMGFTPDGKQMYYTDTSAGEIYRFDYEVGTGELANRTTFLKFTEGGLPDGMTVDAEGNLWVAFWGGSCVRCFGPDGAQKAQIDLPAECITCPVILPDGRMYVTSAGGDRRKGEGDLGGCVFLVHLDVAGVPEYRSRLGGGAA